MEVSLIWFSYNSRAWKEALVKCSNSLLKAGLALTSKSFQDWAAVSILQDLLKISILKTVRVTVTALVFRVIKSHQPMDVILLNFINWFLLPCSKWNKCSYRLESQIYAELRDPKVLWGCDPWGKKKNKPKTTAKPWEKLRACFLEAKKSGVDWYFCGVIIKCPLFNMSCTFRLTWAEVWIHNLTAGAALELAKTLMASPERYL